VGASGTPDCCHEHETQTLYGEAPPGGHQAVEPREERPHGHPGRALRRVGRAQRHRGRLRAHPRIRGRASAGAAQLQGHDGGAAGVGGLAGQLPGDAGRDGGDRLLLEAGLAGPGGPVRVLAAQRAARAQPARPQDRPGRRGLAMPAGRARPGPTQLRAAPPDPGAAGSDPLSQGADPGADPGGPAARQGPPGRGDPSCPAWLLGRLASRCG
jgi:hypothetical protein